MFSLIDRLLIQSYVKSYVICLVSLLGLYIVVDLFNNIDDFARIKGGLSDTIQHIGTYYGGRLTFIFDRMSEAVVLLAAMFTIAWMQRSNEILPLLSAGVSTQRIVRPVLLSCCAFIGLNIANQELLIPRVGNTTIARDDSTQEKDLIVNGAYDDNLIQLSGRTGVRKYLKINHFTCVIPASLAHGSLIKLEAKEAFYIEPVNKPQTGGWLLTEATCSNDMEQWSRKDILEWVGPGKYFLYTDIDFNRLTRDRSYYQYLSLWELWLELKRADATRLASIAVQFHMRLTRPLLSLILVLIGLGVILRDQNRHIFISMGFCMVLCGLFFGSVMGARYLGDHEVLSPALAAWLPVFLFGPVGFVLFDAVHT